MDELNKFLYHAGRSVGKQDTMALAVSTVFKDLDAQAVEASGKRLSMIAATAEELSGATVEFEYTDDCREFVYVDGKLALVFHPPTMESRRDGESLICTLKQKVEKRYLDAGDTTKRG